jgi:protein O-GlcNAc transferase
VHRSIMRINNLNKDRYLLVIKNPKDRETSEEAIKIFNEGFLWQTKGRLKEAMGFYQKVLKLKPNFEVALNNLSYVYRMRNECKKAIPLLLKVVAQNPVYANAYFNLGYCYKSMSMLKETIYYLKKGLEIKPRDANAWAELGTTFNLMGWSQDSIEALERAIKISPEPAFYNNLGITYVTLAKTREARICFQEAIRIAPKYANAYCNLGILLSRLGDIDKAIKLFIKASKLERTVVIYYNLGYCYGLKNMLNEAINALKIAERLDPKSPMVCNRLFEYYRLICDWENAEKLEKKIVHLGLADSLTSILISEDPKTNLNAAKKYSDEKTLHIVENKDSFKERKGRKKIRVGYLSADFNNSPVAHLISGIFALHNKNKFEVFTYSYGNNDGSFWRKRIERESDKFVDLENMSNEEMINTIVDDKIDILVDLMGYTSNSRIEILKKHPVPIQITYLGFPGTSGAEFIDYLIADKVTVPRNERKYFTEKVVNMPNCYMVSDDTQIIDSNIFSRSAFGLPENSFVFSSFINVSRIEPKIFRVWMNILKRVPNSILWLKKGSIMYSLNIEKEARANGVNPQRILFSEKIASKKDHLARLGLSDLALDTRIYGGHTTTADYLFSGVPVVTMRGKHFASRVAASILMAAGLSELVTKSMKEYEDLAVEIALDKGRYLKIKNKLSLNKRTQPFFKTKLFVNDLEKLYQKIWKNYLSKTLKKQNS